jgi:transposase
MKKHSNSLKQSEAQAKRRKLGVVVERKPQQVMAELVAKLAEQLDAKIVPAAEGKKVEPDRVRPNLDRLTVGVDLGDQWSNYCILGLAGETLAEGQFRTRKHEVAEFFQVLAMSRVVIEVGTHSAWVQESIAGFRHEVLVANPRLMEGSKRRRRKNDRIDAEKLARLGRMDPKSLHPIQHRSTEVREDLLVLRARDALVKSRTELINSVRGLVKSMGGRVISCSRVAFSQKAAIGIPEELKETLQPLMAIMRDLTRWGALLQSVFRFLLSYFYLFAIFE